MKIPDHDGQQDSVPPVQRERRERKLIQVEIEREHGPSISALITNVSEQGMGGRTNASLLPNENITVVKKGYGRITGEVRWVEGDQFGVLFSQTVDVEMFNFADQNKEQQHFVQPLPQGHVLKVYDTQASSRRPGLTSQYSRR